jgi:hypothetical protein
MSKMHISETFKFAFRRVLPLTVVIAIIFLVIFLVFPIFRLTFEVFTVIYWLFTMIS